MSARANYQLLTNAHKTIFPHFNNFSIEKYFFLLKAKIINFTPRRENYLCVCVEIYESQQLVWKH